MGMKMAKASEADLRMAMELCNALEALNSRWGGAMPEKIAKPQGEDENEYFSLDDEKQCRRVCEYLIELTRQASLSRVIWGAVVMLDPRNKLVDPAADTIEHHPDMVAAMAAKKARPLAEWAEENSTALWWRFPIVEAPYCGHPNCDDWPGDHTHWTPLVLPEAPPAPIEGEVSCVG
jgi:hypothetical protein